MTKIENNTSTIIDFSRSEEQQWMVVNDGVMGGISQSKIVLTKSGTAVFQGSLSLENNGGFASTRTITDQDFVGDHKGVIIRIKGDGKRYQLRLRTDRRFDGVSYRSHFQSQKNAWQIIKLPFDEFEPVYRGRILEDVPSVKPEKINQIGFLISDKQAGRFQLEIDWIQAYR